MFQAGHVDAVAGAELERIGVEEVVGNVEQAQPLGAWAGALRSGQHQMEDVLRGIADIPTGDEPLDALDVPGAVGLFERFGSTRADIGTGVGLGEHHGGLPAALHALGRPPALLIIALDVKGLGQHRAQVEKARRRVGAVDHFVDGPCQRRRRWHATELLGQAQPPPAGLLDCLHCLGQLVGHADGVGVRVEDRWVAVGVAEGFGDRTLGQPRRFGQDGADRVDVQIAVASGAQDRADIKDFEQVELEIADIGDVVSQCGSLQVADRP